MEDLQPQQCGLFHYLGNIALWRPHKTTAFLCSPNAPPEQVLKCLSWATAMRDAGKCVMLGTHSPLEKDMLRELLKGTQPVILVLAKCLMRRLDPAAKAGVLSGRLLVVTQFGLSVRRETRDSDAARIELMLWQADKVVVGYADPAGLLKRQLAAQGTRVKQL